MGKTFVTDRPVGRKKFFLKGRQKERSTSFGWDGSALHYSFTHCLEQGAEFLVEGSLGGCAYELVDELSILKEEDGWNVAHAELDGDVVVLVDVALAHYDATIIVVGEFADDGTYHAAGAAPGSPEVYNEGQRAREVALKVVVGDCYFHVVCFDWLILVLLI